MAIKRKKISLFGGSFNPIHNQHIKIIQTILNKNLVDEIWIVPSKNHPFSKQLTSAEHRINMIKLGIQNPKVRICDVELKSDETNYTIRTIQKLKKQYPYEFFWIMGSDILHNMDDKWAYLESLLEATEFIICKRKDYAIKKILNMKIKVILDFDENSLSSTQIRKRVKQGKSLKNLVPLSINKYIKKENLYK